MYSDAMTESEYRAFQADMAEQEAAHLAEWEKMMEEIQEEEEAETAYLDIPQLCYGCFLYDAKMERLLDWAACMQERMY